MNPILDTALQALGLRKAAPTVLDVKLLTDGLGRTLPMSSEYVGTAGIKWRGTGEGDLNEAYTTIGTVFSIVSYILDVGAPIPWGVYTLDGKDNQAKPVEPSHPLASLLYRPNPKQTWAELKRQAIGCRKIRGEYFLRRVRPLAGSRKGKTAELWCLLGKVELLPLVGLGEFDTPTGYRHTDALTNIVTDYPADEILHVKTFNPTNPHRGLSPIGAGNDDVTVARSSKESRGRQYQNQGPQGVVYSKPSGNAEADTWTPEQANRIQDWFNSFFGINRRRSGQIPIVSRELGYLQMGLSPKDLDNLDAIPYDKDALCDIWHFPGQLLNGSRGTTFSNMGEAGKALYNRCVLPDEYEFKDKLNGWLGPEYDDKVYINIDVSHIPELQEDKKAQVEWLKDCYWLSTQEKQRLMGLPVDETMPPYLFPSTLVTLADLTGAAEAGDAAPKPGDIVN